MKFAHIADCHIGGWREDKLKQLGIEAFNKAIDTAINERVGFILISGDLFDTALPSIDLMKEVSKILRKVKDHDIDTYIIPGSHDFSVSGKTMLHVLEKAGLVVDVMKFQDNKLQFTEDKTNVKITGLLGRKGGLDKNDYETLDKEHLEKEQGFKIFMFHNAITEFKPADLEKMDSVSSSLLPKNFNYYAGGHPHYIFDKKDGNSLLTFPGALFPNNFAELEKFNHGGFYIVDDKLNYEYVTIKLKDVLTLNINANNKIPEDIEKEILEKAKDIDDKIITIRIEGILKEGKPNDINFKEIFSKLSNAYCILKNTNKLTSKEFEELEIKTGNVEDIEANIVKEHLEQININLGEDEKLTHALMNVFNKEKDEGEKNIEFETRLVNEIVKVLNLDEIWK